MHDSAGTEKLTFVPTLGIRAGWARKRNAHFAAAQYHIRRVAEKSHALNLG